MARPAATNRASAPAGARSAPALVETLEGVAVAVASDSEFAGAVPFEVGKLALGTRVLLHEVVVVLVTIAVLVTLVG